METTIKFTRVNNDVNGNPRYACHFLEFITDRDREAVKDLKLNMTYWYEFAIHRAKTIGGKRYNNKSYGGGYCVSVL
jgi:hypothetical protein